MARSPVVDIHAHFVPEGYLRLIEAEGQAHGLSLRLGPDGPFIMIGPVPIGPITPAYHDLDRRLQAMDAQGVTIHALSLMPPMVYWADAALGLRLARLVNDAIAEAVRARPDRLVGLTTLPLQAPEAAVAEVGRAVTELGLRGVYLGTNVRGADLDDPSLEPVFARIAELGVPVFLHPLNVVGARASAPTTSTTCWATPSTPRRRRPRSSSAGFWTASPPCASASPTRGAPSRTSWAGSIAGITSAPSAGTCRGRRRRTSSASSSTPSPTPPTLSGT